MNQIKVSDLRRGMEISFPYGFNMVSGVVESVVPVIGPFLQIKLDCSPEYFPLDSSQKVKIY